MQDCKDGYRIDNWLQYVPQQACALNQTVHITLLAIWTVTFAILFFEGCRAFLFERKPLLYRIQIVFLIWAAVSFTFNCYNLLRGGQATVSILSDAVAIWTLTTLIVLLLSVMMVLTALHLATTGLFSLECSEAETESRVRQEIGVNWTQRILLFVFLVVFVLMSVFMGILPHTAVNNPSLQAFYINFSLITFGVYMFLEYAILIALLEWLRFHVLERLAHAARNKVRDLNSNDPSVSLRALAYRFRMLGILLAINAWGCGIVWIVAGANTGPRWFFVHVSAAENALVGGAVYFSLFSSNLIPSCCARPNKRRTFFFSTLLNSRDATQAGPEGHESISIRNSVKTSTSSNLHQQDNDVTRFSDRPHPQIQPSPSDTHHSLALSLLNERLHGHLPAMAPISTIDDPTLTLLSPPTEEHDPFDLVSVHAPREIQYQIPINDF